MNYVCIRVDIGSTSETCVSHVLGNHIASGPRYISKIRTRYSCIVDNVKFRSIFPTSLY